MFGTYVIVVGHTWHEAHIQLKRAILDLFTRNFFLNRTSKRAILRISQIRIEIFRDFGTLETTVDTRVQGFFFGVFPL